MKVVVRTKVTTYDLECEPGERVLYAGLRAGIPLPYECATGTCGTCKARCRSEGVKGLWALAPGNAYLKPERGEFLMCQSVVERDCEVLVPGRLQDWRNGDLRPRPTNGELGGLRRLTHDVMAFHVRLDSSVGFRAGQFLALQVPGIDGFRAYSMVNYSSGTQDLKFVMKRKPGGGFSEWLFETMPENVDVQVFGPLGRATFDPGESKNLLCIAGGSGIAGTMAILSHACEVSYFDNHRGFVFFGIRTMKDAFFLEELSAFKARAPHNLYITVALSDQDAPVAERTTLPTLDYATGFVHKVTAEKMRDAFHNMVAFVAGPPAMVDGAIRMLILEGRLPAADIRYDKFS